MLADVLIWGGYIALFIWLSRKGSGHDVMVSGRVGFGIQAFAYVLSGVDEMEKAAFPEYWLRERCLFCCGGTEDAGRER